MRIVVLPLVTLLSLFSMAPQENTTPATAQIHASTILVELAKSIKADKARPGDPVQFRLTQAILAGKGIVIPKKARLYGRVLVAEAARDKKPSVLSVMIERAEWDGRVLPLHAFVTGWGKQRVFEYPSNPCALRTAPIGSGLGSTRRGAPPRNVFDWCRPSPPIVERYEPAHPGDKILMKQIKIYQNVADGSTFMTSEKNIRLPSGLLLVFNNVGPTELNALK